LKYAAWNSRLIKKYSTTDPEIAVFKLCEKKKIAGTHDLEFLFDLLVFL
jgi:hypothetical protein